MHDLDSIRTLVVHEDPIVAAGLTAVLQAAPEFSVIVPPASVTESTVKWAASADVDVVVADYHGGLEMLAAIKEGGFAGGHHVPKVFIVTQLAREWEVRCAVNAGVFGYVLQSCDVQEILSGVRLAGASRRYLCEAVAERIAESLTRVTLTARESEVLELLQQGMCNKTIARDLGIAPGTVKAHVKGILEKLESTTRTQAVSVAAHRGLIRANVDQPIAPATRKRRTMDAGVSVERRVELV